MKHQGNVTEETGVHGSFACVFFSKDRILEAGVQNIMVDIAFYKNDQTNIIFVEHQAMEAVLSDFVSYAKRNLEKIWSVIMKNKRGKEKAHAIVSTYEIVKGYWDEKGINFSEMLKMPPAIEWPNIFERNVYDDEELIEIFISSVRKRIQCFYAIEKRREGDFLTADGI